MWAKRIVQRAEGRENGAKGKGLMLKFRFQDLVIWQDAIEIADKLFDIADFQ
ncbi:MAG: hypothetical protein ABIK28_23180 [Planctomycetota bacterium]